MGLNYKERSKEQWGNSEPGSSLTLEHIQLGCIQRIADATELMAKDRLLMESTLAFYKKRYEQLMADNKRMARRIFAYQGHLKRLKNKVK